ncbi:hypothetical protein BDW62DRAFT_178015 [Aspergillus aurantiobrunneus]
MVLLWYYYHYTFPNLLPWSKSYIAQTTLPRVVERESTECPVRAIGRLGKVFQQPRERDWIQLIVCAWALTVRKGRPVCTEGKGRRRDRDNVTGESLAAKGRCQNRKVHTSLEPGIPVALPTFNLIQSKSGERGPMIPGTDHPFHGGKSFLEVVWWMPAQRGYRGPGKTSSRIK